MHTTLRENAAAYPILAIGAASTDVVSVLDHPARLGELNLAATRFACGGVARNVAENLARLGQPASLVSVVGNDEEGRFLLEHTRACGVDVSGCFTLVGAKSSSYLAVYEPDGCLQLAVEDMDALAQLDTAHLHERAAHFAQAGLVFVDANLRPAALRTVFSLARKAGAPVCVDATTPGLASRALPFLPRTFLLSANAEEASVLTGGNPQVSDPETALQAARWLVGQGVEIALISLAQLGVCYATANLSGRIPALLTQVVDPTGAGDALVATVLFGLTNAMPLDDAVRLGVTAAALVLRHPGPVLPGLSLERLYDALII